LKENVTLHLSRVTSESMQHLTRNQIETARKKKQDELTSLLEDYDDVQQLESSLKLEQDFLSKERNPDKIIRRQKVVEDLEKALSQCSHLSRTIEQLDSILESDSWEEYQVSNVSDLLSNLNDAKTLKIREIQIANGPVLKMNRQKSLDVIEKQISIAEEVKSTLALSSRNVDGAKLNAPLRRDNPVANDAMLQAQNSTTLFPETLVTMSTPSLGRQLELTREGKIETMRIPADITFSDFKTLLKFQSREGYVLSYRDKENDDICLSSEQDWIVLLKDNKFSDLLRVHERKVASPARVQTRDSKFDSIPSSPKFMETNKEPLNIDELVKLIQDHADGVEACKDQVVVFFIGNKGAGKSTTISWLLGRPPERVNCEILVLGKPDVDEVFRIRDPIPGLEDGKDQYQSVTKHIRAFPREDIGLTFCDAPGYKSETPEMEIANCVAITAALHAASSVRPVFVVTKKSIDDLRGLNFQEVVETISELIKTDFVHHVSSFSFLFTHCYEPSETHKNTNMPRLLQKAIQKNLNSLISQMIFQTSLNKS